MGKLCMVLCWRCPSSLHHKRRQLEKCSQKARSSSKYRLCKMPPQILLFQHGTCPPRRQCTMLRWFVLQRSRTCPRRSPCNHHCLLQICTCLLRTLCMLLCRRLRYNLHCKYNWSTKTTQATSPSSPGIPDMWTMLGCSKRRQSQLLLFHDQM